MHNKFRLVVPWSPDCCSSTVCCDFVLISMWKKLWSSFFSEVKFPKGNLTTYRTAYRLASFYVEIFFLSLSSLLGHKSSCVFMDNANFLKDPSLLFSLFIYVVTLHIGSQFTVNLLDCKNPQCRVACEERIVHWLNLWV